MKTIWKFPIRIDDSFTIEMPEGAEILAVQTQYGVPQLWAVVDPVRLTQVRFFKIFGMGHPMSDDVDSLIYVGTFQIESGALVFHLFEDLR